MCIKHRKRCGVYLLAREGVERGGFDQVGLDVTQGADLTLQFGDDEGLHVDDVFAVVARGHHLGEKFCIMQNEIGIEKKE